MPEMVRMGVRAYAADDQRPLGSSSSVVVLVDENGAEVAREVVPDGPKLVLRVVHSVVAGDQALLELPFVVEPDDGVAAEVAR